MAHNGGRTQTNFNFMHYGGMFPFINAVKQGVGGFVSGDPSTLDANGYPTAAHPAAVSGRQMGGNFFVPTQANRPGQYVCKWTGGDGTTEIYVPFESITGSKYGANGRFTFTPANEVTPGGGGSGAQVFLGIVVTGATPVTELACYHINDEAKYQAGQIFTDHFLSVLTTARFGVLRDLNWAMGHNNSNCSVIAHKKPVNAFCYAGQEYRASLYVGTTTNTGDAYSCADARTTGTPADKTTVLIKWNATASGASPTLNGKYVIDAVYTDMVNRWNFGIRITANTYCTLVFDADLDVWLMSGQNTGLGLQNGIPPEIFIELCNQVGAHPWWVMPMMAADPITDWGSGLATLCKANLASGLIPRFEGPNETWNNATGFWATRYGWAKNSHHWESSVWSQSTNGLNNWYGKVMSTLGQQISTAYSADRTKYQVICGTQEVNAGSNSDRFNSTLYVSQNGGSAAKNWVTHGASAPYIDPIDTYTALYSYALEYINPATTSQRKLDIIEAVAGSNSLATSNTRAASFRTELTSYGVTGMTHYEGGWQAPWIYFNNNPAVAITGISKAASAVVTFVAANNYPAIGQYIVFLGVSGMTEINNLVGIVTAVGTNTFTVDINSTGFSTWTSGGTATYCYGALITGITKANPAVISYSASAYPIRPDGNGLAYISGVAGMTEINAQSGTMSWTAGSITMSSINSSAYSTYTSGGRIAYYWSTSWCTTLGEATKQATAVGEMTRQLYQGFVARGGEFPSNYTITGYDRWGVIDNEYQTSKIMDAITTYNTTTRPYRMTVTT